MTWLAWNQVGERFCVEGCICESGAGLSIFIILPREGSIWYRWRNKRHIFPIDTIPHLSGICMIIMWNFSTEQILMLKLTWRFIIHSILFMKSYFFRLWNIIHRGGAAFIGAIQIVPLLKGIRTISGNTHTFVYLCSFSIYGKIDITVCKLP